MNCGAGQIFVLDIDPSRRWKLRQALLDVRQRCHRVRDEQPNGFVHVSSHGLASRDCCISLLHCTSSSTVSQLPGLEIRRVSFPLFSPCITALQLRLKSLRLPSVTGGRPNYDWTLTHPCVPTDAFCHMQYFSRICPFLFQELATEYRA